MPPKKTSSSPFEHSKIYDNFLEVFKTYVAQETSTISLKKFHKFSPEYIIHNSILQQDIKSTWNLMFTKAITELSINNKENDDPNWGTIMQGIINKHIKTTTSSTSPTSASSKTSNLSLSHKDRDSIDQTYMSMDPHKKWEIEPGVFVEDRMYEYGKSQSHEHASHSFILDLGDVCWKTVFTDTQLKKLEETNVPPLAQPPPAMKKFVKKFKNVDDIDVLRNIAEDARFHATEEFDADWCKRCILDILCAYRWGVVKRIARHGKERDLIMRVYRAIDLAFDDLWVDVQRSDQLSSASSARINKDRRAADGSLQQKMLGTKPDMIIAKDMVEYGLAEHGYDDEAGVGSKELVERFIKLPKTMKDMLVRLASEISNEEDKIRQLNVVGFSHTHTRVTGMVMNVPAGYVCRVKPLKELKLPMELSDFYKTYIQFLMQVFKLKHIVRNCIDVVTKGPGESSVDNDTEDEDEESGYDSLTHKNKKTLLLPSCITLKQPIKKERKRKASEIESDDVPNSG